MGERERHRKYIAAYDSYRRYSKPEKSTSLKMKIENSRGVWDKEICTLSDVRCCVLEKI